MGRAVGPWKTCACAGFRESVRRVHVRLAGGGKDGEFFGSSPRRPRGFVFPTHPQKRVCMGTRVFVTRAAWRFVFPTHLQKARMDGAPGGLSPRRLRGFVVSAVRKIADGFRELARTVYGLIERGGGTVRVLG